MKRKKIDFKNYVLLFLITIATFLLVFVLVNLYNNVKTYDSYNSSIVTIIPEIKINEMENYLTDNPNTIIYLGTKGNKNIEKFEGQLKDFIVENNLQREMVYLNVSNVSNTVYKVLFEKYLSEELATKKINVEHLPNLLAFEEKQITDILYKNKEKLKLSDFKRFLQANEIIESD